MKKAATRVAAFFVPVKKLVLKNEFQALISISAATSPESLYRSTQVVEADRFLESIGF
jgi:hypothetical protein